MISYFLGLPGSGKTYKAVEIIFNNFSDSDKAVKDKKATYKNCYTNINEFKFYKVKEVYSFDFDEFYSLLEILHSHYKDKVSDDFLLQVLSEHNYKDTLFIIDECHKYLDVDNKILVWWLSYHRHLNHEIILITQNLSLVHSKYKTFSEFFYVAKPRSLSLFTNYFKYNIYCSSRLSEKSKSGSIKLKLNKEVFELYKSGDSINSSNVILKFLMVSAFLIIFLIIAINLYINSLSPEVSNSLDQSTKNNVISKYKSVTDQYKNSVTPEQDNYKEYDDKDDDFENRTFFIFSCSKKKCSNDLISIPPKLLRVFIYDKYINVFYKDRINKNLVHFYLDSSTEFYNYLLPKRSDNAEINKDKGLTTGSLDLGFLTPSSSKQQQH